jgi:predicted Zn-dependent peptidase
MNIKEYQLTNGLKVIHNYSEGSEMIDVRLSVRAGGFYDFYYDYNPGISHFLEHLTLSGKTKKYPDSKQFKAIIQNCGGLKNGQTGTNKATFYATVLKEYAEEAFDSVSQTVFNSEFDEETMEKERKIIAEERHSIFKKTGTKLRNMFYDIAFKDSGYTYFPIGTEE